MIRPELLVRWRVPLGWGCGLLALYLAEPEPRLYAAGVALAAVGEAIRLWASGHLEKNRSLATSGPYRYTRNPLYFGSLWMALGFALATGRWLLLILVAVLFVLVYRPVMRREARHLTELFGREYPAYAARTPLFWPLRAGGAGGGTRFSLERVVSNREHWTVLGWMLAAGMIGWKLL